MISILNLKDIHCYLVNDYQIILLKHIMMLSFAEIISS